MLRHGAVQRTGRPDHLLYQITMHTLSSNQHAMDIHALLASPLGPSHAHGGIITDTDV